VTLSRGRTTLGALGLAAAGLLAISACGSNNNTTSSGSSTPAGSSSSASASASSASGITCASGTLTASGSTAQQNAIDAWTKAYQTACSGATINYPGGGSGQGYTDFTAGTDDFAGSDYALSATQRPDADKRCAAGGGTAVDLPMTPGAIAIGYNLSGVSNLKLSAATLAGIFDGTITSWNDPKIKADNPGVTLPSTKVSPFVRSDTSGTSFNFSNYLTNDAGSAWTLGANKQFPGKGQGEKGSALVASTVEKTNGGIGYFELSFATTDNISTASIGDSAGNFIAPSAAATTKFLSTAKVIGTGGDLALSFDYTKADASPDSYPNTLVTYEFVCTAGNKNAALLKDFLSYTSGAGQGILQANGYVPLPTAIQTQVQTEVAKIA
jgi:phosphate transport system substrate-binding protein